MGILNEILLLQEKCGDERDIYERKLELLQGCIYGIDIQPMATEIARLRCFLSLIIDENPYDIKPLPNLEFKFMQGNSLLETLSVGNSMLEIIPKDYLAPQKVGLFDEGEIKSAKDLSLFDEKDYKHLQGLFVRYFSTSKSSEKQSLKNEILDLMRQVFDKRQADFESEIETLNKELKIVNPRNAKIYADQITDLMSAGAALQSLLDDYATHDFSSDKLFLYRFFFAEVMQNGGFDIIIGNPPYGNINKSEYKKEIETTYKNSYFGEISSNFAELAHNLLKPQGCFMFITSYALTFTLTQSGLRNLLSQNYKNIFISTYDRDGCPQFDNMKQSVCILLAKYKQNNQKANFQTSNFIRQKITRDEVEFSPIDNLLLIKSDLGNDFSQKHRLPKIGGLKNLEFLRHLKSLPNKLGNLFDGDEILHIKTSGNYWYNAFLEIPYESTEIKTFSVRHKHFIFCLINSNVYYLWARIYADGRHNNTDIMKGFRLPNEDLISKYNDLWEKLALSHWQKMISVFTYKGKNSSFATSQIKDSIDILDYHICLKILRLDMKTLKYICDYDKNIRGGIKCDFENCEI